MNTRISEILLAIAILSIWVLIVLHINDHEAHGIQVKKCSFWVFICHMEEHYIENCEVGKWLDNFQETYYINMNNVMIPITEWYNVYEYTCYREYDNGTQTTIVSTKNMKTK